MTIEQALRYVEDRAALMQLLMERVTTEPQVLIGLGDIFEDIEAITRRARQALTVTALAAELPDR